MMRREWFRNCRKRGPMSLHELKAKVKAFSTLYDCFPITEVSTERRHGVLKTIGRRYVTVRVAASEWRKAHDEQWLIRDVWGVTIRTGDES